VGGFVVGARAGVLARGGIEFVAGGFGGEEAVGCGERSKVWGRVLDDVSREGRES